MSFRGPHAPLATELAVMLAREYQAAARAVYVTDPNATPEVREAGRARIATTLAAVREQDDLLHSADPEARER